MALTKKQEQLLERGVEAVERLAQDPVLEIEAAPPMCPHCGNFNPIVIVTEGSDGPLSECVLYCQCQNCNQAFYAMPVTWHMHQEMQTVREELKERAEIQNGQH